LIEKGYLVDPNRVGNQSDDRLSFPLQALSHQALSRRLLEAKKQIKNVIADLQRAQSKLDSISSEARPREVEELKGYITNLNLINKEETGVLGEYQSALKDLEMSVQAAKLELNSAEDKHRQVEKLFKQKVVSEAEL